MKIDHRVLTELCDRNDVATVRVFGSMARGEDTSSSDIDLLVEFRGRKSLLDLVRIEREFSEQLGRQVELLTPSSISPYMREHVFGESKLLYERAD
jgi:uncharacterized protein